MDKALPDSEMRKKVKPRPHAGDMPHHHAAYPHLSGYRGLHRSVRL